MDNLSKVNGNFSGLFDALAPVADDALEGWVRANTGLVILKGHRTVLRRDYRSLSHVKILSGGWSGFEPMCSGFVGPGMLTAAIHGEKASAPPYLSILAAIRELSGPHGVLVLVMNHPTLKVNFSLAVDIAQRENITVKLICVTDDCSGQADRHGRKGLAGTAMLFKIAGAMAERNRTLEEIYSTCADICTSGKIATISVHILNEKNSNIFKSSENFVLSLDDIYGYEPPTNGSFDNIKKVILIKGDVTGSIVGMNIVLHKFVSIDDLTKTLLGYILDSTMCQHSIVLEGDKSIAILFNNYGSVLNAELNAFAHDVSRDIEARGIKIKRTYIGSVITTRSLGFSITCLAVTDDILNYLDYPTQVSCWPTNILNKDNTQDLPRYIDGQHHYTLNLEIKKLGPILSDNVSEKVFRIVEFTSMALISCEEQINKMAVNSSLNLLYGTLMKGAAEAVSKALYDGRLCVNCPYTLFQQLSAIMSSCLPDMAGSCYSVFFEGASQTFLQYFNQSDVTMATWADALQKGIEAIEFFTHLKRGERTMLDALYPALETLKNSPDTYAEIAEAAELGSINTVDGSNKRNLLPDPGSHTVAVWVRAAVEALNTFDNQEGIRFSEEFDDDIGDYDDDDDGTMTASLSLY